MSSRKASDADGKEILVVEDEMELANLYKEILQEEYESREVKTAHSGEEALELIGETTDLVLLDRRMPGMNGEEVLGEIRDRGIDCSIAMVTAVDPSSEILKFDVDEYLVKPISQEDLVVLVDDMFNRLSLDDEVREYLALSSRKEALEREQDLTDLQTDEEYRTINFQLRERRDQITASLIEKANRPLDPIHAYQKAQIATAMGALTIPAVLLIMIHFWLPYDPSQLFALGSPAENLFVGYLSSFFHKTESHLYGNIIGYLIVVVPTYILCLQMLADRWFYLTGILLLTLLPVLTSVFIHVLLDVLVLQSNVRFVGFSHVVSGLVGFSLLAFLLRTRLLYHARGTLFIAGYIVSLGISLILFMQGMAGYTLAGAIAILCLVGFLSDWLLTVNSNKITDDAILINFLIILVIGAIYAVFGVGMIPTLEIETNYSVMIHLLGFGLGLALAVLTAFLTNVVPIRNKVEKSEYRLPDRVL